MKKNANKQLEDLVDKALSNASLDTPSFGFTQQVMQQVHAFEPSKITTYKPLISKMGWFCISLAIIGVFVFLVLGNSAEPSNAFNVIQFNVSFKNIFSGFAFSGTLKYALILFAVMLCIQVPLLKHYFNRRMKMD